MKREGGKKTRSVKGRAPCSTMVYDYVVPEEVPDSYLDDLLALRWRENLKLWTIQWARSQESQGEESHEE